MLWEGRRLRDIGEADLRQIIDSGLEEHVQLEYKSALYEDNDRGRREFLLDVCMFANAEGGVLLIGVTERRDEQSQPTGIPDSAATLGINLPNPQLVLNGFDARVVAAIEERLPLESAAINVENGLQVLAIRVANSPNKPHCVRYQGHVYFPSRRERHRYEMDVREIKELVMRTASRLEQGEQMLQGAFLEVPMSTDAPYLMIGVIPVFWKDFLVDIKNENVSRSVGTFDLADPPGFRLPSYGFAGIDRRGDQYEMNLQLRRNGLVRFSRQLPLRNHGPGRHHTFFPTAIDLQLRKFTLRTRALYQVANLSGPYLLSMMMRTRAALAGLYPDPAGLVPEETEPIPPLDYRFPVMLVDDLSDIDTIIRPFCDQVHQTFGREASPNFSVAGAWTGQGD